MPYTGGWKHWNIGDTLQSADVNNYFMSQAIPRFASTTARDAALTGADAPAAGQLCYVTGTGLMMYNGATWGLWPSATYTDSVNLTGSAASIGFTAIPRTVKTVRVMVSVRSDQTGNSIPYWIRFAGDSGTNYYYSYTKGTGYAGSTTNAITAAASGSTFAQIGSMPGASYTGLT